MSEAKEILKLIICILAVYTASALFAAGVQSFSASNGRTKHNQQARQTSEVS